MRTNFISLFLFLLIFSFSLHAAQNTQAQKKPFIVVLDAGHGGKDPGNRGNGFFEKDIALNIVLKVGKELEKNKDIKVIYTRKTDVFLDLIDRAAIANKADANLFVSVHCNAHHSQAYGTETFVLGLHKNKDNFEIAKKENQVIFLEENYEEKYAGFDPNSPESLIGLTLMQEEYLDQSIELASYIQENFTQQLKRKDRSVKQAGFWVLHNTFMPSVLIETGFLTNKSEGQYLNSEKGQREMATAISQAILNYYNKVNQADAGTVSAQPQERIEDALEEEPEIYKDVTFKVQLAASSRKLDLHPSNFKGLKEVSRQKEGDLFKYFYGSTSDYTKIKVMHTLAKQKGYTTSFIVAYKNGKREKLSDILKNTL